MRATPCSQSHPISRSANSLSAAYTDRSPLGWAGPVQLEESEFTCAAAVKARKAMEVEIEDLHLQIDDIAKAKTAVRSRV